MINKQVFFIVILIFATLFICSSCFLPVLPRHFYGVTSFYSRGEISNNELRFIEKGLPKWSVLKHIGEPDYIGEDGRIFIYRYSLVVGRGLDFLNKFYFIIFEFDLQGTLAKVRRVNFLDTSDTRQSKFLESFFGDRKYYNKIMSDSVVLDWNFEEPKKNVIYRKNAKTGF